MNTTDLRVIKTLENIREGFARCIAKKRFSSVSVGDIAKEARINRSTFYKYYEDKYQLREVLIQKTMKALSENVDLSAFQLGNSTMEKAQNAAVEQLQFMYDQKEWYLLLWNPNMELYVYEDMIRLLELRTKECLRNEFPEKLGISPSEDLKIPEKPELFARLFAASALATIKWWYEYAPHLSSQEVADIIMNNIRFGMYKTFFKN